MLIPLDRGLDKPLHCQIHDHLADLIHKGVLAGGDRLPPTRQLSADNGVTRTTVNQAYEDLQAKGLVRTIVGAGTFVAGTGSRPESAPAESGSPSFDWESFIGDRSPPQDDPALSEMLDSTPPDTAVLNLLKPIPDPTLTPLAEVRRAFKEVLRTLDATALDYGSPWGYEPLREVLGKHLATEGMDRSGDATLLVNGSQQGIDLLVRTLVSPGEMVVTERPAYKGALRIFQAARAQVRCLPMDEEGMSLTALERTLRQDKVRLLYLTPTFQNPTGCSMGTDRRKRILHLAHTHQVPVLEDGCFRELRFEGTPPPSLKSLDEEGLVIHLGTYSKTLFPGLRVGWIAAPRPLAERLSRARHDMDLGSVTLAQMVIHNLYLRGDIARQLDRVRRVYKERRHALLQGLDRHLPEAVTWTRPEGGMSLWVHLPPGLGSLGVVRRAARAGVLVAPGALFDPFGHDMDGFRLAFSMARPEAMDHGARILGEAIRAEIRNKQTSAQPPESRLPVV